MKYLIVFILGSFVGALAMKHFTPAPAPAQPIAPDTATCSAAPPAPAPAPTAEAHNYELYNSLTPSANKIHQESAPAPPPESTPVSQNEPPAAPLHKPTISQVWFTEDLVQKMETSWNDLPSQISVTREAGGWRIHSFPPGSLFAETGLQPGDLIPDRAIDIMRETDSQDTRLGDRVTAILNHSVQR